MKMLSNLISRWRANNRSTRFKQLSHQAGQQKLRNKLPLNASLSPVTMPTNHFVHGFSFTLALALLISLGCAGGQGILGVDEQADFPAGAIPEKSGQKACRWHQAQASNAAIDRQVFYRADFVGDSVQIGPAASKKFIERIQFGDPTAALLVILEPSENPQLDQHRIGTVTSLANQLGVSNAHFQIGFPPALGLLGSDAERLGRSATSTGNLGGGRGNGGGFGRGGLTSNRGF